MISRSNKNTIIGLALVSFIFGAGGGLVGSQLNKASTDRQQLVEYISSESDLISDIAERVAPSVVSIEVISEQTGFFRSFGSSGFGTGIILSSDGYVVTNRHVVPEGSGEVSIVLNDGTRYDDVEVVGRDPRSGFDIAFLKINGARDLQPAEVGDSTNVQIGDRVIAIGNALGQYQNTVTTGIVSGISRPIVASDSGGSEGLSNLIQTDAAINPGNSGGPLFDVNGQVIGINTAVANGEGIGFAIPVSDISSSIQGVLTNGKLEVPYVGVRYSMIDNVIADRFELDADNGAYIYAGSLESAIVADSPAEKAGIFDGDIITEIDGVVLDEDNSLASVINRKKVGDQIELKVIRGDEKLTISLALEAAPESL
ncbi:MAG: trypsin-like peptidase domain-containing protein [Patescibacteria group bacterium]